MQQNYIKAIGIVHATMENKTEVLSYKDQQNEKDQQERPWSDLPQDLLSLIMSNLFVGDCSAFNMVCKSWRPITPAIRPLPPPIGSPHCQSPCLMFFQRSNHNCKLFHPLYNDFYHMELPEILDAKIRFSKYGWLLMSREDLSVFFFNPSTKVTIELPKMPSLDGFATMCFTSPPTSLDCSVVGFLSFPNIEIGIIRRGEGSWTTHEFRKTQNFFFSDCNPIFHRRMFYCLGVNGNVGIFDPRDNACSWTIPVKCLTHCGPDLPDVLGLPQQSFLVKIGGMISAVLVAHEERRVSVYRLNQCRMVWRTLHTLGDKTLYVSRSASFAETAIVKGTANKIYFPKFHGMNGVFYSLATRKFHSLDGDFSSPMSYGLKHIPFSTWFKPTFETQCNEELEW